MKLLIDIGHPAHFHLFHNLAKVMQKHGNDVLFTCREKECTADLLKAFGFEFISFGKPYKSSSGKLWGLLRFNYSMLLVLLRYKPNITLSHGSMYAAQVSWLLGIPHISMEDTGNIEQIRLYRPFTKAILVPDSFHLNLGKKQIPYPGNHELAYLHPNRFNPDDEFGNLKMSNTGQINEEPISSTDYSSLPDSPYILLRFVAWNASHDKGHSGISDSNKHKAIAEFSKFGYVFISSEAKLSSDFEAYRLNIPPEKLHTVLASAMLLYGESATMASEAAILGVPAIFVNNAEICYTREEEKKYGMVFNFTETEQDQNESIMKGIEVLATSGIREEWQKRRQRMLNDKIDVTAFLVWFVENWPDSMNIMKATPGYTERFKNISAVDSQ